MAVKMPNDFLKDPQWLAKFDAERRQPRGAGAILKVIHLKKGALQSSDPDLADADALANVFRADPELYARYRDAVLGGRP